MVFPGSSIAGALDTGNTGLTFVINSDPSRGLAISVPGTGIFSTIVQPETTTIVSLQLETVTVTDTRRGSISAPGAWTTSAVATDLTSLTDTLTASSFSYASGVNVLTGGTASITEHTRSALNSSIMVEAASAVIGNHVVTWRPTLAISVSEFKKPGTYSGTITHSVA